MLVIPSVAVFPGAILHVLIRTSCRTDRSQCLAREICDSQGNRSRATGKWLPPPVGAQHGDVRIACVHLLTHINALCAISALISMRNWRRTGLPVSPSKSEAIDSRDLHSAWLSERLGVISECRGIPLVLHGV